GRGDAVPASLAPAAPSADGPRSRRMPDEGTTRGGMSDAARGDGTADAQVTVVGHADLTPDTLRLVESALHRRLERLARGPAVVRSGAGSALAFGRAARASPAGPGTPGAGGGPPGTAVPRAPPVARPACGPGPAPPGPSGGRRGRRAAAGSSRPPPVTGSPPGRSGPTAWRPVSC